MDFAIEAASLARILAAVKGCVLSRETIPMLRCVLLEASAGQLTVRATDLDKEASASAPADVKVEGVLAVPGAILHDLARRLPKAAVATFTLGENNIATLKAPRSSYLLRTLPADDFPKMQASDGVTLNVAPAVLKTLLSAAITAVAPESDKRAYLQGVFLHNKDGRLVAAASDSHRLVVRETPAFEAPEGMPSVILPTATVHQIIAMLDMAEGDVEFVVSETRMTLRCGSAALTSKLIDGEYPDYSRLIPMPNGVAFTVKPGALGEALERATIIANSTERAGAVGIAMTDGGLRLLAGVRIHDAEEADEIVDAELHETIPEIGVAAKYLGDALKLWPDVPVDVQQSGPGSPILFTSKDCPELKCVVMPMRR